jgi:riboflavin kinase / FMN adenylyltransferase
MEYTTTITEHKPIVITIGNFDGIHKGHQRLMHELQTMAQALECIPAVVTFSPHSLAVIRPEIFIQYLTTVEEKLALIQQFGGIADSIVIHFTPAVAAMSAQEFMDDLCAHFTIKGLVVGTDFNFGHNRMGNIAFLKQYGQEHQIQLHAISLEEAEHSRISSTRIRALVKEGNISEANELLGHAVRVSGIVKQGDRRGRLLGFPTANLQLDPHKLLPADGVYAVYARIQDRPESDGSVSSRVYKGVTNIGTRPTFNGKEHLVEAHLLDVDLDLYEKYLELDFIARLRGEQRFPDIEALKVQITADAEQARQILATGG